MFGEVSATSEQMERTGGAGDPGLQGPWNDYFRLTPAQNSLAGLDD